MANQNNTQGQDLGQLLQIRREKLANLQAAGQDPFQITKYDQDTHSADQRFVHDKRMNDCLPPILFSAIFKLLKVLPDTELDAC